MGTSQFAYSQRISIEDLNVSRKEALQSSLASLSSLIKDFSYTDDMYARKHGYFLGGNMLELENAVMQFVEEKNLRHRKERLTPKLIEQYADGLLQPAFLQWRPGPETFNYVLEMDQFLKVSQQNFAESFQVGFNQGLPIMLSFEKGPISHRRIVQLRSLRIIPIEVVTTADQVGKKLLETPVFLAMREAKSQFVLWANWLVRFKTQNDNFESMINQYFSESYETFLSIDSALNGPTMRISQQSRKAIYFLYWIVISDAPTGQFPRLVYSASEILKILRERSWNSSQLTQFALRSGYYDLTENRFQKAIQDLEKIEIKLRE